LEALLSDCRLLFLDSRHPRAARLVALEARKRAIPVLMDIEKVREGMLDLLPVVDSLNTSSHFPAMYHRGIVAIIVRAVRAMRELSSFDACTRH
jgi:hypothetical protein